MELTQLQIDLFKSLAGLVIAGGLLTAIGYSMKLVLDKVMDN